MVLLCAQRRHIISDFGHAYLMDESVDLEFYMWIK